MKTILVHKMVIDKLKRKEGKRRKGGGLENLLGE